MIFVVLSLNASQFFVSCEWASRNALHFPPTTPSFGGVPPCQLGPPLKCQTILVFGCFLKTFRNSSLEVGSWAPYLVVFIYLYFVGLSKTYTTLRQWRNTSKYSLDSVIFIHGCGQLIIWCNLGLVQAKYQ